MGRNWLPYALMIHCSATIYMLVLLSALLVTAVHGDVVDESSFSLFTFSEEPQDVVVSRTQKSLTLNCAVKVDSGLSVRTEWFKDGRRLDTTNARRFLSNGSLLMEDGQVAEGLYRCAVSAEGLGSIISRAASVRLAYMSKVFQQEPTDLTLYLSDVAMLPCSIQAEPSPTVQWLKDGRELDVLGSSNLVLHPTTGLLEIRAVQFGDFGRYRCKVSNVERTKQSREVVISQNGDVGKYKGVGPVFTVTPPPDLKVKEGAMVLLHCGANGRDRLENRPVVSWLKDGHTIDLSTSNSRFSRVGESSLRLDAVTEQDSGWYTCRAANAEESIDANTLLTVLVPPKLRVRPRNAAVTSGADVDLLCDIYSNPPSEVLWYKNSELLKKDDSVMIVDGHSLRILGAQESDKGVYQCITNNSVGSMQAAAQLVVHSNALLKRQPVDGTPSRPQEFSAPIVSMHFVTLSWQKPRSAGASELIGYMVTWQTDGSNRFRALNVTAQEANAQHLRPSTRYTFNVSAYNRHGVSQSPAQIIVNTQAEAEVPEAPVGLRCSTLSTSSVQLIWGAPSPGLSSLPLTGYRIHYYAVVDVISEHEEGLESLTGEYVMKTLQSYTQYSFRVVAINSNGAGESTEEVLCRTYADVPRSAPQNITTEILSSTSIVVRWDPVEDPGVITGYRVLYRPSRDKEGSALLTVTDASTTYCSLNDLSRGIEYNLKVQAVSINGTGPASASTTATTFVHDLDESRVPDEPSSFHVRPYTSSIVVSWTPPLNSDIRVRGYILGYGIGIPDVYRKILDAQQRYYTIKGLTPSSEYVLNLKAFNGAGEGKPAYETIITREEPTPEPLTPIMPPVGLKAIVLSPSTIVLTWSDLTLGRNQRVVDNRFYSVRYYPLNSSRKQKILNCTDLNLHIDDLRPDTEYEFSVKVTKGRRQSTWSLSVLNRTMEALPFSSPRDVTPVSIDSKPSWVSLSWQPPRQPNGQVTGYLVFYTTDATQRDRDWVVEGVPLGDRLSVIIRDLSLETTYYFKVLAQNSIGNGPASPTVIFRTPRADGSGGGVIEMPDDYGRSYVNHAGGGWLDSPHSATAATRPASVPITILWISIGCISGVTVIAIIIIVAILCRRRLAQKYKGGYTSANKNKSVAVTQDLSTPDLWIHDRMEMKHREGGMNEEGVSMIQGGEGVEDSEAGSERDDDRYRRVPLQPHRPKPVMIPVDQPPPPTISNGHISPMSINPLNTVRPSYPRTQYTSAPRVNAAELTHPYPPNGRPTGVSQILSSSQMRPPLSPASSTSSSSTRPPGLHPSVNHHTADQHTPIRKSESTEELTAEMANLEGLMKDLSVITQQEFEC